MLIPTFSCISRPYVPQQSEYTNNQTHHMKLCSIKMQMFRFFPKYCVMARSSKDLKYAITFSPSMLFIVMDIWESFLVFICVINNCFILKAFKLRGKVWVVLSFTKKSLRNSTNYLVCHCVILITPPSLNKAVLISIPLYLNSEGKVKLIVAWR